MTSLIDLTLQQGDQVDQTPHQLANADVVSEQDGTVEDVFPGGARLGGTGGEGRVGEVGWGGGVASMGPWARARTLQRT